MLRFVTFSYAVHEFHKGSAPSVSFQRVLRQTTVSLSPRQSIQIASSFTPTMAGTCRCRSVRDTLKKAVYTNATVPLGRSLPDDFGSQLMYFILQLKAVFGKNSQLTMDWIPTPLSYKSSPICEDCGGFCTCFAPLDKSHRYGLCGDWLFLRVRPTYAQGRAVHSRRSYAGSRALRRSSQHLYYRPLDDPAA